MARVGMHVLGLLYTPFCLFASSGVRWPDNIRLLMSSPRTKSRRPGRGPFLRWILVAMSFAAVLAGVFWERRERTKSIARQPGAFLTEKVADAALFPTYGKSASCRSCHQREYELWERSHHALAERAIDARSDAAAFEPDHRIQHGSQISEARSHHGKLELLTKDIDGEQKSFVAERVIGVAPLRQFLVPAKGGRLQVTELAYDPNQAGWFDVYGTEDRRPGEWGHWTGRGMTWNAMCAACHNTRLRKNYRENRDDYATSMAEMGVGCEACHGPMAAHNAWQAKHPRQTGDPNASRISREAMFSVCGSCHSRRLELTGDFRPGDNFFDHYALAIPDETDIFYADGQIRDEDYEYTSFLSSRMAAAGVRCIDCHEPHSGKTRLEGNALCLSCHAAPVTPAPKIDPQTHSHHKFGERGGNCVDCHMPQTVYMQRHGRHDHGFTIPDPLLTRQIGVPNACARCHADRGADWALAAVEKWYGSRMERPTRARAQIISRARTGESSAAGDLMDLARNENNSLWRAVAVGLLKHGSTHPKATAVLLSRAEDAHPVVRTASVHALEPLAQTASPPVLAGLRSRLQDPVRAVRVAAAWALHSTVETNSV